MIKRHSRGLALVIEDEVDIRKFASRLLTLEGFDVLKAGDGEQGLKLARQNNCILVLLDLKLPGRDGWSVLKEMKSESALRNISVIVFTASASIPQQERALDMGAADYLVKPLSAANIRDCLARVLKPKCEGI